MQTNKASFRAYLEKQKQPLKADEIMADLEFMYQVVGRGTYSLAMPKSGDAAAVIEAANALLENKARVSEAMFVPAIELRLFHRGVGVPPWTTKAFRGEILKLGMSSTLMTMRNSAFGNAPHVLPREGFTAFAESLPAMLFQGVMTRLPGALVIPPDYLRLDKLFYSYAMYHAARDNWGIAQLSPTVELAKRGLLLLDRKVDDPFTCLCLSA